jgi:uncharacterized protein
VESGEFGLELTVRCARIPILYLDRIRLIDQGNTKLDHGESMKQPGENYPHLIPPSGRTRRNFLKTIRNGCILGAGLLGWTALVEPFWIEVNHQTLSLTNLPAAWANKRIVQISDLHVGRANQAYLQRAMEAVNSLEPDVVLLTGDLIDLKNGDADLKAVLERLEPGKIGSFGSLGNHDYGPLYKDRPTAIEVTRIAQSRQIQMLRNERVVVEGLEFVGLEDFWSPFFYNNLSFLANECDLGRPAICLCHNPDVCDLPIWGDYQGVILSGHTHGGQCKPPFLPPPLLPVVNRNYTQGHFQLDARRQLFITRGVGYSYQVRFNCRPEITVFQLQPASPGGPEELS